LRSASPRRVKWTVWGATQIITANLQRSALFAPIDPAAYIERIDSIDAVPRFPDWRNINAQALVTGRVGRSRVILRRGPAPGETVGFGATPCRRGPNSLSFPL
jgi:hypothetical protein